MTEKTPPADRDGEADREFSTILERLQDGETIDIEELCRSRPHLEGELRERFELWSASRADSSSHCPSTADISSPAGTWKRFIDQLRSRGPAYRRYEFEGEVGRGGMGIVYRVYDVDAKRNLALKVLRDPQRGASGKNSPNRPPSSGASHDEKTLGRFLEEAQVTSQLDHPNIVPVHEIGVDDRGSVYFTMKLVKGDDLRRVFELVKKKEDGWTVDRAVGVLLKVCDAMSYAHAKNVIHRDLKPGNVMVGRYGEVYVMDWGLARVHGAIEPDHHDLRIRPRVRKHADESKNDDSDSPIVTPLVTMDGDVIGTPSYMPPEQAAGELDRLGPWSDVYAVGAMLYHLLTGEAPYSGALSTGSPRPSAYEILGALAQGPPPPILAQNPEARPELVAICEKAMRRETHLRYPSMLELASDLRAHVEHRVVAAYESGLLAELRKWIHRNQALAVTTAAAAVTIAVLLGWSYLRIHDERNAAIRSARVADLERQRASWLLRAVHLGDLRKDWNDPKKCWPADPSHVSPIEAWLVRAIEALKARPEYEGKLDEFRTRAIHDGIARGAEFDRVVRQVRSAERDRIASSGGDPRQAEQAVERALAELRASVAAIEAETASAFGADPDAVFFCEQAALLLGSLDALEFANEYQPTVASMQHRLAFARSVTQRSRSDPKVDAAWTRAANEIRATPAYRGLSLAPQLGLVPLGKDEKSGLQEFAHLQSGEVPSRDAGGKLIVTEASSFVFVLLPGGEFTMGAQSADPRQPNFDPDADPPEGPPQRITLAPYFVSKYETSQAQWRRLTGAEPSHYKPGRNYIDSEPVDGLHPVETVSFEECADLVARLGMGIVIPTEAQWEYACRGGTTTPFFTGKDVASLSGYANLADAFLEAHAVQASITCDTALNDGFAGHARVDALLPNPFGMHHIVGNVREWCRDTYTGYGGEVAAGDAERKVLFAGDRVYRGGCFDGLPRHSRCSHRDYAPPRFAADYIGVRFARAVDPR